MGFWDIMEGASVIIGLASGIMALGAIPMFFSQRIQQNKENKLMNKKVIKDKKAALVISVGSRVEATKIRADVKQHMLDYMKEDFGLKSAEDIVENKNMFCVFELDMLPVSSEKRSVKFTNDVLEKLRKTKVEMSTNGVTEVYLFCLCPLPIAQIVGADLSNHFTVHCMHNLGRNKNNPGQGNYIDVGFLRK